MRTVRSAAWARNRPRRCLAWLLLILLLALIALAARVDAAPRPQPTEQTDRTDPMDSTDPTDSTDSLELARQYADAITGADRDAATAQARRDDQEDEDDDESDDEGNDDEDDDGRGRTSRTGAWDLDPPIDDDSARDSALDARMRGSDRCGDPAGCGRQEDRERVVSLDPTVTGDAARHDEGDPAMPAPDDLDPMTMLATDVGDEPTSDGELAPIAPIAPIANDELDEASRGADVAWLDDDEALAPETPDAAADAGALAMRDAELDPGDALAGADAAVAAATAGAAERYEQSVRHPRPSRWGRLDVGVAWRTRWSEPMHAPASHRSELWLVATWRR